ncbi:ABC transporter ATP-binding protein [Avibacterium sp. 21-599]|uniref:ABC transporter ATP-binding protein n=1 Tax=Avibacterium sp. 21-599 TaxID=2911528 RepID=UPI002245F151|nr:ABC transporter ATP-binding protein [Avibacterium sp. 21-599]MCW9718782.1 ABC transporter ATP-binding protein [Avibacterium sp. 21-599]
MTDIIIDIKNVSIRFNKATENITSLKEYIIKLAKKELMFQEFFPLKDINLQIRRGEAWGLIGRNGSGKSTLLKLICGILSPYQGTVSVKGNIAPLIELGAGFDGELTAKENIYLNASLLGYNRTFIKEHFNEIIEFSELQEFIDVPLKNFSSGMAARLGFAIATMVKPDILIVDEVLAVGDTAFQEKCKQRMAKLLDSGTTLLFVSHSIDQVKELCKYGVLIQDHSIRMKGDINDVAEFYTKSY